MFGYDDGPADPGERVMHDGTLTIRIDEEPGRWSVAVLGELDDANADALEARLRSLDHNKAIALDFSGLEFMGAAGVELLLRLASDGARGTRSVGVVHASEPVERLLSLCGLDTTGQRLSGHERLALDAIGLRD